MAQASVFTNRSGNVGGGGSASQGATGPTGATGATGATGPQGATGAEGAAGAAGAGVTWKGAWSSATAYVANDVVYYNGIAYLSILAGTNKTPNTETSYWDPYTAGITGPTGATGATGDTGAASTVAGPAGPTGATGDTGVVGPAGGNNQKFIFSNSTEDGNSGSGMIRLNHATFSSVTKIFPSDSTRNGVNVENWLGTLDDNTTNSIRGTVTLFKETAPDNYVLFNINDANDSATGYKKINVAHVASNGSFTHGDYLILSFVATGAKGDSGATGATGAAGAAGATGATGPVGAAGATGATGAAGADSTVIGPTGAQGAQGVAGPTGAQGPTGDGDKYATTSNTSISIGTGSKTLTIGTGLSYSIGQTAVIAYDSSNQMSGPVTSYNSGTGVLVVNVSSTTGGPGPYGVWSVNLSGAAGPAGAAGVAGATGPTGPTGSTGLIGGLTHTVTYQAKTSSHPYFGSGSSNGFSLDGTQGKSIVLLRGYTYYFNLAHASNTINSIYISTSSSGGGSEYSTGVSATGAIGTDYVLTFTVPHNAPDTLYYWGSAEAYVGGVITVSDVGPTGATGATGAQGSAGPTGAVGAASTVAGPAGPAGPAGSIGPTGPTGGAGVAGATGATGAAGAAGPAGATGATGAAGSVGATGPAGAQGTAGTAGATGATGATGDTGLAGDEPIVASYDVGIVSDKYYVRHKDSSAQAASGFTNAIVELHRGFTYEFDLSDSSNLGKTFKLSLTADGTHSAGTEYTTGVTATGTPGNAGASLKLKASQTNGVVYFYAPELPSAGGSGYLNCTTITTGATGATGATGDSGSAGATGATGATGAAGAAGADGAAGTAGATGATGATGAVGATGAGGVTHTVTVSNATGANAYYLNGNLKRSITVFRGYTYYFNQSDSSTETHQVYIATVAGGQGASSYSSGQSYSGTAGTDGVLTFTVPHNAPSTLYYECVNHPNMGGVITVTSQGITGAQGNTGAAGATGPTGPAGSVGSTGPTGAVGSQGNIGATGATGATGPGGSGGTAPVVSTRQVTRSVGSNDYCFNIFDANEFTQASTLTVASIVDIGGVISEACTMASFKAYVTSNGLTDSGSSATLSVYKNGVTTNIDAVLNSSTTGDTFVELVNSVSGQSSSLELAAGDNISLVVKMLGTITSDNISFKLSAVTTVGTGATGATGASGTVGNTGPTGASGSVNTGDIKKYSLIFG